MSSAADDRAASGIDRLLAVMAALRNPDGGCPWDLEQNFATIAPYTIEEAYEVADAIRADDLTALRDELGDLLLQVVFHAQMAREQSAFDFDDVARGIADKMIRRHPHVFGAATIESADAQTLAWEDQKAAERAAKAADGGRPASVLDDVALALPALLRAQKLQKRAARVGFDWREIAPVVEKISEEAQELVEAVEAGRADGGGTEHAAAELGDILFACVNLARHLEIDAEEALRGANARFEGRFRHVEHALADQGRALEDVSLEDYDRMWEQAKAAERKGG